ncbi:MAG TPA: glycoside hydrolase family 16 protein [Stackebrandtia sp.]|jgi:beta-glucanase (GH16 family)|uniref:glycoside hydrolase family 16 protein n=1 Tax=Stackebrandtia sp. TaxID=2023065 RepID=UPI002D4B63CD|nr:glycoside hydrolase family 16 protein [Stackebrandtia sp.]HZE41582.1 glycoside hydrolase family 16 protein [Stackebrandtia sp.]
MNILPKRRRRWLIAAATGLALVGGLTIGGSAFADDHAKATWADDFDGAAGTAPDGAKWNHEVNGDGGGNQELQYYTDSTDNAALDGNGNLVITARKENPNNYQCWYGTCTYTSARLTTANKFTQQYGHVEARIKIPRGSGMWPAFWMLGSDIGSNPWPNCGEIDVMENIGSEPSTVHGSLHGPGYSGGNPLTGSYNLPGGGVFADDFHTFAVDWAPDHIAWSVDGQEYERHTPADTNGNPWAFDHPFFIILNVAVGGGWPGSPGGDTQFPQTMVVDYVHVSD